MVFEGLFQLNFQFGFSSSAKNETFWNGQMLNSVSIWNFMVSLYSYSWKPVILVFYCGPFSLVRAQIAATRWTDLLLKSLKEQEFCEWYWIAEISLSYCKEMRQWKCNSLIYGKQWKCFQLLTEIQCKHFQAFVKVDSQGIWKHKQNCSQM